MKSSRPWRPAVICSCAAGAAFFLLQSGALAAAPTAAERRQAVLTASKRGDQAVPELRAALADENALVRRAAARALVEIGPAARSALQEAVANSDALVRRVALIELVRQGPAQALPALERALKDDDAEIRFAAVQALAGIQPRTDDIVRLLQQAQRDPAQAVRGPARAALWPFHKETVLLRHRADARDRPIVPVLTYSLPLDDWRFKTDPAEEGHLLKWYEAAFADKDWARIPIGKFWQDSGYAYEGVGWYRTRFTLPAKPECHGVEIQFESVDESAWVWINGEYVGQHDIGPQGWNVPFALDAAPCLQWGAENQLTVRVLNTKFAGGIWKPVTIQALKVK
jgi:hypothetical protein